ncbi:MAG: DUF1127 domain-containing protein [Nitratireductor sp.]|nr:DUF1127 domain-containing protein [Nitratireductor sp.]
MTIQKLDTFDPITRKMQNLDALRAERLPLRLYRWLVSLEGRFAKLRSRRQLAALEDWQLEDIGITPERRDRELNKSFWD